LTDYFYTLCTYLELGTFSVGLSFDGSMDVDRGAFSVGLYLISCFLSSGLLIKSGSISSSLPVNFGFTVLDEGFLATDGASFDEDFGLSSGFLLKQKD
jgi:hypothetical protein